MTQPRPSLLDILFDNVLDEARQLLCNNALPQGFSGGIKYNSAFDGSWKSLFHPDAELPDGVNRIFVRIAGPEFALEADVYLGSTPQRTFNRCLVFDGRQIYLEHRDEPALRLAFERACQPIRAAAAALKWKSRPHENAEQDEALGKFLLHYFSPHNS